MVNGGPKKKREQKRGKRRGKKKKRKRKRKKKKNNCRGKKKKTVAPAREANESGQETSVRKPETAIKKRKEQKGKANKKKKKRTLTGEKKIHIHGKLLGTPFSQKRQLAVTPGKARGNSLGRDNKFFSAEIKKGKGRKIEGEKKNSEDQPRRRPSGSTAKKEKK